MVRLLLAGRRVAGVVGAVTDDPGFRPETMSTVAETDAEVIARLRDERDALREVAYAARPLMDTYGNVWARDSKFYALHDALARLNGEAT